MTDRKSTPAVTRFRLWLRTFVQSETSRRKDDGVHYVRPNLETLEDRTLPSASSMNLFPVGPLASPPAASSLPAITSSMFAMMEQRTQLIATVEQYVIGAYEAVGQEIAQAVYSAERLWGSFFGINLNNPNPSQGTIAAQPGGSAKAHGPSSNGAVLPSATAGGG